MSYEAGVAPASGNAGAADPTTQGWAFTGVSGNQFAAGYDSGNGGWRTVDGTTTGPAFYQQNLSVSDVAALSKPWSLNWTLSLDSDAIGSAGATVANYYETRTDDDITVYLQTSAFSYILEMFVDTTSPFDLSVQNGAQTAQLTSNGSGFDAFHELSLVSFDGGATANLIFDGAFVATFNSLGAAGQNRVVFGADSTAGQGSAIWNQLSLQQVPEPQSLLTWCLLGIVAISIVAMRARKAAHTLPISH